MREYYIKWPSGGRPTRTTLRKVVQDPDLALTDLEADALADLKEGETLEVPVPHDVNFAVAVIRRER